MREKKSDARSRQRRGRQAKSRDNRQIAAGYLPVDFAAQITISRGSGTVRSNN